jgi:hypothetical protein
VAAELFSVCSTNTGGAYGLPELVDLAKLYHLGQTLAGSRSIPPASCEIGVSEAGASFQKRGQALGLLKIRFGRLRDCGLGTEWSVPFFEPGMPFMPVGKTAGKLGQPELIPFASRERRQRVCVGGSDSSSGGRTFPPSA